MGTRGKPGEFSFSIVMPTGGRPALPPRPAIASGAPAGGGRRVFNVTAALFESAPVTASTHAKGDDLSGWVAVEGLPTMQTGGQYTIEPPCCLAMIRDISPACDAPPPGRLQIR
ncbi:hypothetical protein [Mesorhizobium sp. B2-8-5]|uniref:hypothetical protein n=1 Tax=Mesorhizobium sp. B2-8-5 TaxID=2589903 RepID=UPI001127EF66|nr:hypothetical protein [Mesorhizobium sp. B2-8-5]UCI24762.1 hypothetical protein FJ430_24745 [Mesorhizobium sp. B2-8-5]